MANEAIYLGPPGSQVELAYPDSRPESPRVEGGIISLYNGAKVLHHASKWGNWTLNWTQLTTAEKDEIETEFNRLQELSFVIGTTSYPVLCLLDGFRATPRPGTSPQQWDVSLSLTQSDT